MSDAPWESDPVVGSSEPWKDDPVHMDAGTALEGTAALTGATAVNAFNPIPGASDIEHLLTGQRDAAPRGAVPAGQAGAQVAAAVGQTPVGGAASAGAMMGGPFGGAALPPDVQPSAPQPATTTLGSMQGPVEATQAALEPVSPTAADVVGLTSRVSKDALSMLPFFGGFFKGLDAWRTATDIGGGFDPRTMYDHPEEMRPAEAPPKTQPGPPTVDSVTSQPDRIPPPPPPKSATEAAAPTSPTPGVETPATGVDRRQPVPGKPHIRLKAQPSAPATEAPAAEAPPAPDAVPPSAIPSPETDDGEISSDRTPDTAEQNARVGAIRQLQADTGAALPNIRASAVNGDYRETGTDYQLGELGNPHMREQLDQEQAALKSASQQVVNSGGGESGIRGGDRTINQGALEDRGTVIDRAIQGIHGWFENNIRSLYRNADGTASQRQMSLNPHPAAGIGEFHAALQDPTNFTGTEGMQLHGDVQRIAQHFGLLGSNGFYSPTTMEHVERFRQWLGEQGANPKIARSVGRLKDGLDADVARAGGAGTYDSARALRFRRDQLLKGPGIEPLVTTKLPNGRIERSVDLHKIADHIANLPTEDFNHVVNVLHDTSKLDPKVAADNVAAIRALRQHMAERLHESGINSEDKFWNSRDYDKKLNAYSRKLPALFSPEGIQRMQTVRDAGNALRVNKRYGGAIKQAKQFMEGGGWSPETRKRIASAGEDFALGWLGPTKGIIAGASGISGAVREGIERRLPGGDAAVNAQQAYDNRVRPLGQRVKGQGGWVGNLKRDTLPAVTREEGDGGRWVRYRTDNGVTVATRRGDNLQIHRTNTEPKARGSGEGVARMAALADEAHAKGGELQSDTLVSNSGKSVYSALAHLGYDIKQNPNAERVPGPDGSLKSTDGRPIFTVGPRKAPPRPPLRQGYDPADALLDDQVRRDTDAAHANPNGKRPPLAQGQDAAAPLYDAQASRDAGRPLSAKFPGQRGGPKYERDTGRERGGGSPPATVNIGLHRSTGEPVPPASALKRLAQTGARVTGHAVHQSNTEPTLVADLDRALTPAEAHSVSADLGQESIAQHSSAGGELHGPGADKWRPFNPAYFMDRAGKALGSAADETPLKGAPDTDHPNGVARASAASYMDKTGHGDPVRDYRYQEPEASTKVANAYDRMKHNPDDPATKAAYAAFNRETLAQYDHMVKTSGLKVTLDKDYPYKNPRDVSNDVRSNNHMSVYPTEGNSEEFGEGHPMLKPFPRKFADGKSGTYNDAFRAIHDYYGHVAEGNGFRSNGEYNAWRAHRQMFSEAARPAMDSETLGQNSWVNWGPHGEANRVAQQGGTVYPKQKAGILPQGVVSKAEEGLTPEQSTQSPQYKDVAQHLSPAERAGIESSTPHNRANAISNLLDTWHGSTSVEGTAAMALAGRAKKGWYASSGRAINSVFGPDAPRFTALLAAMSPQTSVEMNFHNALHTFINWDAAGRPTDMESIKKIMEDSSLKNPDSESKSNVLDAWAQNGVRALTSANPEHEQFQLSGPKVDSFYRNLRDNAHEVTNDSWNAIAMGISQKLFAGLYRTVASDPFGKVGFKSPAYMGVSAKIRAAAMKLSHMTGESWSPREVQETLWSWVKTAFEYNQNAAKAARAAGKPVPAEKSIPDLLHEGLINDDLIRSTPDFAQLFSSKEHSGFLDDSRFADAARRMAAREGSSPKPAGPSEKSAAAAQTLRPALLSEAGRLEGLRRQRAAEKGELPEGEVPF